MPFRHKNIEPVVCFVFLSHHRISLINFFYVLSVSHFSQELHTVLGLNDTYILVLSLLFIFNWQYSTFSTYPIIHFSSHETTETLHPSAPAPAPEPIGAEIIAPLKLHLSLSERAATCHHGLTSLPTHLLSRSRTR